MLQNLIDYKWLTSFQVYFLGYLNLVENHEKRLRKVFEFKSI